MTPDPKALERLAAYVSMDSGGPLQDAFDADIRFALARIALLEKAVRPFAEVSKYAKGSPDACWAGQSPAVIRYSDLRQAAAALGAGDE